MSKSNKVQKVLVRNPSVPIYPCAKGRSRETTPDITCSEATDESQDHPVTDLRVPEFCTTLRIVKEMKDVKKMTTGPPPPDLFKYQKLNFQPHERIYHDLIDLEVPPDTCLKGRNIAAHSTLKKDPVPDFEKLLKYDLQPEYFFSNSVMPDIQKIAPKFEGHSLYHKTKVWKKNAEL